MKIHTKKKMFQKFCLEQVRAGLINQPDGSWKSSSGAMAEMMKAGYHLR